MKILPLIFLLFFMFSGSSYAAGGGGGGDSIYLSLGAPFVVNINNGARSNFLQITSEVRLTAPEVGSIVTHHMALVRHVLIMLFSQQTPDSIRNLEDKERLIAESLEALQLALEEETGESLVENIYFTGFIVQ